MPCASLYKKSSTRGDRDSYGMVSWSDELKGRNGMNIPYLEDGPPLRKWLVKP